MPDPSPEVYMRYALYVASPDGVASAQPQVSPSDLFQLTTESTPPLCRTITVRFRAPVQTGRGFEFGRLDRVTPLGLLFADDDGEGWESTFVPWANVACISWDMAS